MSANIGWKMIGGSLDVSGSRAWGSSSTDQVDVQVIQTQGYTVPGYSGDYVNHNNDRIWFVVRPLVSLKKTSATAASPAKLEWAFAATQPPDAFIYWVYAEWLVSPASMPDNVRDFLDGAGITGSYYAELLKADPYAYGVTPGQYIDPARFDLVATIPYVPLNSPTAPPLTADYGLTRSVTNSTTETRDVSYTASVRATTGAVFTSMSVSNSFSWRSSTSTRNATGSDYGEVITVGQPSFGYTGPTVLRVYVDKIWKTFFVAQDWN